MRSQPALANLVLIALFWTTRAIAAPVHTQDVQQPGFRGRLYLPSAATPGQSTAILLIGGSEGHLYLADEIAPQLAASGYVVLGIDYHDGYRGPRSLLNVPIETFTDAAAWLHTQPQLSIRTVVALGDSRGSEAAILSNAHTAQIDAVAVFVPSSLVWGSTGPNTPPGSSAWSWQGKPLPSINADPNRSGSEAFQGVLSSTPQDAPVRLPLDRLHGPVFLAASVADAVWPSAEMALQIQGQLSRTHYASPVTLYLAPSSGHRLLGTGPSTPTETYGTYTARFGGTAAGNEQARNQAWALFLAFLAGIQKAPGL